MIQYRFTNFKDFVTDAFAILEEYDIITEKNDKAKREYRNYIYSLNIDTKYKDKMWCWLEGWCFDINDMYSMLGQNRGDKNV